ADRTECATSLLRAPRGRPAARRRFPDRHPLLADPEGRRDHRTPLMGVPRGPQPFPGQEKRLRLLAFVRQDSVVRVDKRVEDTAMTWPHLLVIEFIAAMIWSLGLFIISALFNAPLQDHSTIDCTPNPSKAPWYLLNLQELLLHMDKGLAGVVVPTLWLTFMAAIPYIDRSRDGIGHWFTNEVGKKIAIFSGAFTTLLVFTLRRPHYVTHKTYPGPGFRGYDASAP